MKQTFQVVPFNKAGHKAGRAVYLTAASPEAAERGGKTLLKAFGQRNMARVRAFPYNPLHDPEMCGYVRAMAEEAAA